MLSSAKTISFIGTRYPEQARVFYEEILGLTLVADEPLALVFDSNGTMIRVSKVGNFEPSPFTVLGWEVSDIQGKVDQLAERGQTVLLFPDFEQDGKGIATFPGGTQVAWFKDPDGNRLSFTQFSHR